jgi:hypothetical protein
MRLDLGINDDDRRIPREPVRGAEHQTPRRDPALPSDAGPLERRVEELARRASENKFPKIPPRQYLQRSEVPIDREPADRHVRSRHHLQPVLVGLRLDEQEKQLLLEAGRFRVLAVKDIAKSIFAGDERAARSSLRYLKEQGLISLDTVNARRDGRSRPVDRIDVVTLTRSGEKLARHTNRVAPGQRLYHGLVKPREVEHDAQIYRACLKEAARIERAGGTNPRVQLDFELKSQIQKAIYAEQKANPGREMAAIKRQVARRFDLPYVNDGIQIPDARIEYDITPNGDPDIDQGPRTGHADIEVLTAAYSRGHLRSKAQAGFQVYAPASDRASLSAKIEDDHHLMDRVLDL